MHDYDNVAYATKGTGSNYGSTASQVANGPPNFVGSVELADERVGSLLSRINDLANRLVGSVPQDPSGAKPVSVPNGTFDSVMERAQRILVKVDHAMDELGRIERALP